MAAPGKQLGRVSSPAVTGGAGTIFEQHVDAYWLALLLVRGNAPILPNCAVVEVQFQTERLGYNKADFRVVGESGFGAQRKLLGQVKLNFTVSARDADCRKGINDFWKDFKDGNPCSPPVERFALVTLRGTKVLL